MQDTRSNLTAATLEKFAKIHPPVRLAGDFGPFRGSIWRLLTTRAYKALAENLGECLWSCRHVETAAGREAALPG